MAVPSVLTRPPSEALEAEAVASVEDVAAAAAAMVGAVEATLAEEDTVVEEEAMVCSPCIY